MDIYAGTSGFSYKAWKGPFYPADLKNDEMLRHYGSVLRAVEINNTFYRMPRPEVLAGWAQQVPEGFRFVIKTPQRITHRARLNDVGELFAFLWKAVTELGERRGPLLVQLPPNFKADPARLETFLAELPDGCRVALEFRHASWDDPGVHAILREHGAALCLNDPEDGPEPEVVATAGWGYLRLRRAAYDDDALSRWSKRVGEAGWSEAYVFFKHEDEGAAPAMARRFQELF